MSNKVQKHCKLVALCNDHKKNCKFIIEAGIFSDDFVGKRVMNYSIGSFLAVALILTGFRC